MIAKAKSISHGIRAMLYAVSYTHLRAHETDQYRV